MSHWLPRVDSLDHTKAATRRLRLATHHLPLPRGDIDPPARLNEITTRADSAAAVLAKASATRENMPTVSSPQMRRRRKAAIAVTCDARAK
jgi:hypothetical protein